MSKTELKQQIGYVKSNLKSLRKRSISSNVPVGKGFTGNYYAPSNGYTLKSSVDWVERGLCCGCYSS